MKMRFLPLLFVMLWVAVGCKDLKEQQLDAYVGDSTTKTYYKNVGANVNKVPEAQRVYFKSTDEAMKQGYTSVNEGGGEGDTEGG